LLTFSLFFPPPSLTRAFEVLEEKGYWYRVCKAF
jgi:hypothetical protein